MTLATTTTIQTDLSGRREVTQLGYEAAEDDKRRKTVSRRITSEDAVLPSAKRDKMSAGMRDTLRNFSVLGWLLRKHLDYVASFDFQARTKDKGLNRDLEALMATYGQSRNCHAAARHSQTRLTRLIEAHATADGDCGLVLLKNGQVQTIEHDLIRNPDKLENGKRPGPAARWTSGVQTNAAGRAIRYAIWKRTPNGQGREFHKTVPARNMLVHGYFDRFDQVRGISPLAPAVNPMRDLKENFQYALAKAKVAQLFALIIKSNAVEGIHQTVANDGTSDDPKYRVKFGNAPQKLELKPGDDAEVLESNQPSSEFVDFTRYMLDVACKALDIPYSFVDESHTNFFGSMAAFKHYDRSCHTKRDNLAELLNRWTAWRLSLYLADGQFVPPSGQTLQDLPFEWVPRGIPWWDPAKEIRGSLAAIAGGLDTPQRVTTSAGKGDWFDNIDQIAAAQDYARKAGVTVSFDPAALAELAVNPDPRDSNP